MLFYLTAVNLKFEIEWKKFSFDSQFNNWINFFHSRSLIFYQLLNIFAFISSYPLLFLFFIHSDEDNDSEDENVCDFYFKPRKFRRITKRESKKLQNFKSSCQNEFLIAKNRQHESSNGRDFFYDASPVLLNFRQELTKFSTGTLFLSFILRHLWPKTEVKFIKLNWGN